MSYVEISYASPLLPAFHLVPVQVPTDGWATEGMACGAWSACSEGGSSFLQTCAQMVGGFVVGGGAPALAGAEGADAAEEASVKGRRSRRARRRAAKFQAFSVPEGAMAGEHTAPFFGDWAPSMFDSAETFPHSGFPGSTTAWALCSDSTTGGKTSPNGYQTPASQVADAASPRTVDSLEVPFLTGTRVPEELSVEEAAAATGDPCWVEGDNLRAMALSKDTCREVQRRLEEASGPVRDAIFAALVPHTVELYESPHGNHCLTKAIEVMPSQSLGPLIQQIESRGVLAVAKHRFGCRLMERLTEHCTKREMASLINVFIQSAEELARHDYGNFVIQHLLEHGDEDSRIAVLQRLLPNLPMLSMHRKASHVVQCALKFCSMDAQRAIVESILRAQSPYSLEEIADSRYGSYVAEELLPAMRYLEHPEPLQETLGRLAAALPDRQTSMYFIRVAARFGLVEATQVLESEAEE